MYNFSVWGVCERGEFWWEIDESRMAIRISPLVYVLIDGKFCIEHGIEGKEVGLAITLLSALNFVANGHLPQCGVC